MESHFQLAMLCLRKYHDDFAKNQLVSWSEKVCADNMTWLKCNVVSNHLFGIGISKVLHVYRRYIQEQNGLAEWRTFEQRFECRAKAELREVAAQSKPTRSQTSWFGLRFEQGLKSGGDLNGELSADNWLRQFIDHEHRFLDQFPKICRTVNQARTPVVVRKGGVH